MHVDVSIMKKQAELGWKHWLSFCVRFKKPFFLKSETQEERAAAAAQAQLFLTYETACFDLKASSVAAKIWGVGVRHKAALRVDHFSGSTLVRTMLADAVALDEPQKQKIPITNTTLQALCRTLSLSTRPGFAFWIVVRFAISFLCRISEYAFNDKYTIKWKYILFYTADSSPGGRRRIDLTSAQQLSTIAEMQVTGGETGGRRRRFVQCLFLHYESCYRQAVFASSKGGPSSQGLTTEIKVRAFKIKIFFYENPLVSFYCQFPDSSLKWLFALKNHPLKNLNIPARTHCEVLETTWFVCP